MQVGRHLREKHHDIDVTDRNRLEGLLYPEAIEPTNKNGLRDAEKFGYIPFVGYVNRCGCSFLGCTWISHTLKQ